MVATKERWRYNLVGPYGLVNVGRKRKTSSFSVAAAFSPSLVERRKREINCTTPPLSLFLGL